MLYDGCDLLDVAGPNEIFTFLGTFYADLFALTVVTVAKPPASPGRPDGFAVDASGIAVMPMFTFQNCPKLDLLFVPGGNGPGLQGTINDEDFLGFLRNAAKGRVTSLRSARGGCYLPRRGSSTATRAPAIGRWSTA